MLGLCQKRRLCLLLALLMTVFAVAIAVDETVRATNEEVRQLLAALRGDEIIDNFLAAYRESLRTTRPDITDKIWRDFTRNCKTEDAVGLHVAVFSEAFNRREVLELTAALETVGGRRFVGALVAAATQGEKALDPSLEVPVLEEAEVQKFLDTPIVIEWIGQMAELEAKTTEAAIKWGGECLDLTVLKPSQP